MEKVDEFKAWLELAGAQAEGGRSTRVSALRKIERKLPALGMPYRSFGEAWEADRFEALLKRLQKMRSDAHDGGQDYRVLMPEAEKDPRTQVSSRISWLKQYGRFLAEITSGQISTAERIRRYTLEEYIKPARKEGREHVEVRVGDVHSALNLVAAHPNICQALERGIFQDMANVPKPERSGPKQGSNTVFRFNLSPESSVIPAPSAIKKNPSQNLILYGPPGTGKTFATAREAVLLCNGQAPEDREKLMDIYRSLVAEGRIEFITFHQSMSYEDFVEGLRPMTEPDETEDEGTTSAGFRLKPVDGIFKRIAKEAETKQGHPSSDDAIRIEGRRVFKMSIGNGRESEEEGERIFEEAIDGDYAVIGFYDIDWSDEKYKNVDAILEACRAQNAFITRHYGSDGPPGEEYWIPEGINITRDLAVVRMTNMFLNEVRKGDIVIVSKGNSGFHAIGEVIGDYEFHPRIEGDYAHRRAVRWLRMDHDHRLPVKVNINDVEFNMRSTYEIEKDELNIPALERYINGADEFVLIIDEINRANISKVFGELITLLEPDKRLGQDNELKVRLPYSGDEFGVPSNLHILGTMNTADRSIALLDVALRRRFAFREIMPDASLLAEASGKCGINLQRLLDTINERIEYLYDREHQIGHAYFMRCDSKKEVDDVMRDKVIPLLAEYFFEDWTKIAAVLGDLETHDGPISGGFLNRSPLEAPPGLEEGDSAPRFRWEVRDEFNYGKLTG